MKSPLTLTVLALSFVATSAASAREPVTAATIKRAGQVLKSLNADELAEFNRMWNAKVEVPGAASAHGGEMLAIKLVAADSGGAWVYYTSGHAMRVSKRVVPVYRITDPDRFNILIGASK